VEVRNISSYFGSYIFDFRRERLLVTDDFLGLPQMPLD